MDNKFKIGDVVIFEIDKRRVRGEVRDFDASDGLYRIGVYDSKERVASETWLGESDLSKADLQWHPPGNEPCLDCEKRRRKVNLPTPKGL